jgi:MOSC domain-containing protein
MQMSNDSPGTVRSIWRYPVKSMQGEAIQSGRFGAGGLAGDRAYALIERATGNIASAKNPRKWLRLFTFAARLIDEPGGDGKPLRAAITFPDGSLVKSDHPDIDLMLSAALQREVTLCSQVPGVPQLEKFWPDIGDSAGQEKVTEEAIPPGTFFDGEAVHLLTTASLEALHNVYPSGTFDALRFRPNLVIATPGMRTGFVENTWIGSALEIGEVRLRIIRPTRRCVITTLPIGVLPRDLRILRTAAQANEASVGVYAIVAHGGVIRTSDHVRLA